MEIYTMSMTRPSMLLTRACAPSALSLAATEPVSVPVLAAERAPVSRVHQVQSELGVALQLRGIEGTNGTTPGFKGSNVSISKRYTDGGSGVPPRGRPV
ncbi:hypothetical protein JIG36_43845 [Actinoplanes sp. LDG1-06]|uniref:Uncharacterized protein n=1 Tax=Paractinoplanes ovalisporus TaxID=2810368 RepID=A0ABS2ARM1_9ACTN|nr:hypothetical protein [Actinoplanes ovalisporus]MBM2622456.1 hypothetical protein [Actinoplanes ovalisporus]